MLQLQSLFFRQLSFELFSIIWSHLSPFTSANYGTRPQVPLSISATKPYYPRLSLSLTRERLALSLSCGRVVNLDQRVGQRVRSGQIRSDHHAGHTVSSNPNPT